jgi:ABC-type branched-subunit amino acid transport system substrate-binding protein/LysM repeat protein
MRKSILFIVMAALFFMAVSGFTQSTQDQLKQIRSTIIEKADGREFYIHTVKRGQTLYMISKAYGVDINEVIKENPQVKEGIKADQKIRIPIEKQKSSMDQLLTEPVPEKKVLTPGHKPPVAKMDTLPHAKQALSHLKDTVKTKSVYKVALMLPLYLSEVDAIDPEAMPANPNEAYKSLQFIQFYEGFRLALDSLEKAGLKLKLYVYDVAKDTVATKQMLTKPELKNMNLIIGMLYQRNFQLVADYAEKNNINIVNPITERSELVKGNPRVFKINPARSAQPTQLANYLEKSFSDARILILRDGQYKEKEASEQLKRECLERKLNVAFVEGLSATVNSFLREKENVVIAYTNSTSYILELTRRMYELRNEFSLTLVGLPLWAKIEGLETEYMVGLHTHIMAPYFIDYQNPEVRRFVGKFQEMYKTDPDPLAFQGYDIAQYFLTALWKSGTNFQAYLPPASKKYLQTTFEFKGSSGNGFENQHWEIYKFDNYTRTRVN